MKSFYFFFRSRPKLKNELLKLVYFLYNIITVVKPHQRIAHVGRWWCASPPVHAAAAGTTATATAAAAAAATKQGLSVQREEQPGGRGVR